MIKILIINTTLYKGGASKIARDLFYYLKDYTNNKVIFAYSRGEKQKDKDLFHFGNKIELFIHVFLVRFLGLEGLGSYFSTIKLIKFIEKEGFNIIHIHNLHGYYLNFFKLLSWLNKNNIKVIWTLHDEWVLTWLPAHSMGCEHCISGKGRCINKYSYPKNYFPIFKNIMIKKKKNIFNYKNITFVSPADWLINKIKKYHPESNIVSIKNGVDIKNFYPKDKKELRVKYNIPLDKKIILFSATNLHDKNKGVNYILGLLNTLDNEKYHFVSFGSGKLKYFDNLSNLGFIDNQEILSDVYALADAYLFLSLAETAPLSILESSACNTPVLAFNLPANRVLLDYSFGFIINDFSIDSIKNSLSSIMYNNEFSMDFMEKSSKAIKENFDVENMKKNYLELYKNL